MTRDLKLPGLGDVWGEPADVELRCECGAVEDFDREFCRHDNCPECRDASECCLECTVCHRFVDADEFGTDEGEDDTCIDCQVAAQERAEEQAERYAAMLEDKGDERRDALRGGR